MSGFVSILSQGNYMKKEKKKKNLWHPKLYITGEKDRYTPWGAETSLKQVYNYSLSNNNYLHM